MAPRLTPEETEALRLRSECEGGSIQDNIDSTRRRELLDEVLDEELPRFAEALHRVGD